MLAGITNAWSDQRATFLAASDAGESKWAIVAGSSKGTTPGKFLASGTPTALELTQQGAAQTANYPQVNAGLFKSLVTGAKGTTMSADNGAYAAAATDSSYVGIAYDLTTFNGWKGKSKWNTWSVDGASTNLTQVNFTGLEVAVGDSSTYLSMDPWATLDTSDLLNGKGTFTYSAAAGTLIWKTATLVDPGVLSPEPTYPLGGAPVPSVPEPEGYALALLGFAALAYFVRPRAA